MKLNINCVRDVLIAIEEHQQFEPADYYPIKNHPLGLNDLCKLLPEYTEPEIVYTIVLLEEAKYLIAPNNWAADNTMLSFHVNRLTYSGHEFLQRIRDEKRWGKVRTILNRVGDFSLAAISATAEGITSAAISKAIDHR